MGLISILFTNPVLFIILVVVLLYSVILHEIAHGYVARLFGDNTAFLNGRLTLNPLPHIDPIGALMLIFFGFGWAKPVPVNYYNLNKSRFGLFSVALAGCLTNIFIATIALVLLQFNAISSSPVFSAILPIVVRINIILGAFNLIPIPPLDGSKILMSFLPHRAQESLSRIEPYGFFILITLLYTGILSPVITLVQNLIYGLISILFSFFR